MLTAASEMACLGVIDIYNWMEPLWAPAVGVLAAAVLLVKIYYLLVAVAPRVAAIGRVAAKETVSQPVFWVVLSLGTVMLLLLCVLPYNTFGDDIKMFKETGLTLIKVLCMFLAIWSASVSIANELEGRTALTLLSKPIGRRQFIFGKFLGVLAPAFTMFVLLGAVFVSTISYKVAYDAREQSADQPPKAEECLAEMGQIVPGLVLAFLETVVLASISVAISTRLPMLPNLLTCGSVYALGHLTPLLVQSSIGELPLVTFVGRLVATIFPVLEYFDIQTAVAVGHDVPLIYLMETSVYCVLYSAVAMLVALLLFEDRDLA